MKDVLSRVSTDLIKSLHHYELADLGATIGDTALDGMITSALWVGLQNRRAAQSLIARRGREEHANDTKSKAPGA